MGVFSDRRHAVLWGYSALIAVLVPTLSIISAARHGDEGVYNPSARSSLSYWSVGSDGPRMTLSRVRLAQGPDGAETAVQVSRRQGAGSYAFALTALRDPQSFLRIDHTYRMRAYVRDLDASGQSIGIALANGNFTHQPTKDNRYGRFHDRSWHLLQRTFVVTARAHSDTALYVELPAKGAMRWQVTRASVQEVPASSPPSTKGQPTTVLSFQGPSGSRPDRRTWSSETGGNGWGNHELQTYTAAPANASLDGFGNLVLTARRQDATGPDGIQRHYTSARLTTAGKFTVKPGSYVEAAIRAPVGEGVRPAFWLLGADLATAGWPGSGELDLMEGTQRGADMVRQALHVSRRSAPTVDAPYGEYAPGGYTRLDEPRDQGFHRYGVYFDAHLVQFYVDGAARLTLTRTEAADKDRAWPFDRPQDVILNIAVGDPPGRHVLPARMVVSPISVWEGGVPIDRTLPSAAPGLVH